MNLAFYYDGTEVPWELFEFFVRENLSDEGLTELGNWLRRLGNSGASSLNWETKWFLCSVIENNRDLGRRFLPLVRALPDSVPEKLRLLVAIGDENDVEPLILRLEGNSGSSDFYEIAAAVRALLVTGCPGDPVERFSRIVLTRLRAEEYFQEANCVWETILSAYRSGAVTHDTIVEVARSKGVSRQIRYEALGLIGENRKAKSTFEDTLVAACFEIITSTIAEPVLSPRHRDPWGDEYTPRLRNKAAEVISDIFESAAAEPSVQLKALETLVALSRIGCLPARYAHRFADVCVNRREIDPTIHRKWFLRAVKRLCSRW